MRDRILRVALDVIAMLSVRLDDHNDFLVKGISLDLEEVPASPIVICFKFRGSCCCDVIFAMPLPSILPRNGLLPGCSTVAVEIKGIMYNQYIVHGSRTLDRICRADPISGIRVEVRVPVGTMDILEGLLAALRLILGLAALTCRIIRIREAKSAALDVALVAVLVPVCVPMRSLHRLTDLCQH